jgi:hypothetical protein
MKTKCLQFHIDEVMDNFDFDKVEAHMSHVGWAWAIGADDFEVPTISEMRKTVRRLMGEAYELGFIATGGFYVYYKEFDDGDRFDVMFSISGWSTDS